MTHRTVAIIGLVACIGCGETPTPSPPVPDSLAPPPEGQGVQLQMDSELEAGGEARWCQYYVMPDDTQYLQRMEHRASEVSHHVVLYETVLTPGAVASQLGVFDCTDGVALSDAVGVIYASNADRDEVALPADIGMEIERDLVALLEHHTINQDSTSQDDGLQLNLWYAESAPAREVRRFVWNNDKIYIPPQSDGYAGRRCAVPSDIEVLYATPHMHARGTSFVATTEDGVTVVTASNWGDVPTQTHDPAIHVPAGSFIDVECRYHNDSIETVTFGPDGIVDEMCILFGAYYTDTNAPLDPAATYCLGDSSYTLTAGDKTCAEQSDCVIGSDWQPCAAEVCSASSLPHQQLGQCSWNNCLDECLDCGDCAPCTQCMTEQCPDQVAACDAASC